MAFKVALIGCGNLGSRHLQGLKLTNRQISITVCEPDEGARQIAKERYEQVQGNDCIESVEFLEDYKDLSVNQDFVIIATNASIRYEISKWVVENLNVKYILLEKVVFQSLEDFDRFSELLDEKNIKVWVNCPRRMYGFYKKLKEKVGDMTKLDMRVTGSLWGMGCNSIHLVDLYKYLVGFGKYEYNNLAMDPEYLESKRRGYIEFSGEFELKTDKGNLVIQCARTGDEPSNIVLDGECFHAKIMESEKKAIIFEKNGVQGAEEVVDVVYQSNLTNLVTEQIIDTGECELTSYEESVFLHKAVLTCFLDHMNKQSETEVKRCPIT